MSRKVNTLGALLAIVFLIAHSPDVPAQGLLGGIVSGAGRALGVKPVEELGRNLDAEHKRFKDNNPVYKQVEENASAFVRSPFSLACTANFEQIVGAVRAACSGFSSQTTAATDTSAIQNAKQRLIQLGITSHAELAGISVRWCQGNFQGGGIAPGPNEIILNRSLLSESADDVALTLAHELHHMRQYRSMGAGPFKCNYSQQYLLCAGCQDERHPMEREAYQFEAFVASRMRASDSASASASAVAAQAQSRVSTFASLAGSGSFLDSPSLAVIQNPLPQTQRTNDPKTLARTTCTLDGRAKADDVMSCIDDVEILYADISKWMTKDAKKNQLDRMAYYREVYEKDAAAACQILAHTAKSESAQKTRVDWCITKTRLNFRQLHSHAKDLQVQGEK